MNRTRRRGGTIKADAHALGMTVAEYRALLESSVADERERAQGDADIAAALAASREEERDRQQREVKRVRLEREAERLAQEREAERVRHEAERERLAQEREAERVRHEEERKRLAKERADMIRETMHQPGMTRARAERAVDNMMAESAGLRVEDPIVEETVNHLHWRVETQRESQCGVHSVNNASFNLTANQIPVPPTTCARRGNDLSSNEISAVIRAHQHQLQLDVVPPESALTKTAAIDGVIENVGAHWVVNLKRGGQWYRVDSQLTGEPQHVTPAADFDLGEFMDQIRNLQEFGLTGDDLQEEYANLPFVLLRKAAPRGGATRKKLKKAGRTRRFQK
jgi:hypothetical protein